jgi:CHAD domain-containing protein
MASAPARTASWREVDQDATVAKTGVVGQPGGSSPSAHEVVRYLLHREVAGLVKNGPLARKGDDPEGVHQLRVSARRLRSELTIVAPAIKTAPLRRLRGELRWIGQILGRQRDLDVLSQLLRSLDDRLPLGVERSVVVALDDQRTRESRRVATTLRSKRYRRLVAQLVDAVDDPPLRKVAARPASIVLQPGLADTLSSLFAAVDGCGSTPTNEQLHRIRIMAKRGRYSAEIASSYLGERASAVAVALARVQDVLGRLHDQVVAIDYLSARRATPAGTGSADSLGAAIHWLNTSNEKLRAQWREPMATARDGSVELLT